MHLCSDNNIRQYTNYKNINSLTMQCLSYCELRLAPNHAMHVTSIIIIFIEISECTYTHRYLSSCALQAQTFFIENDSLVPDPSSHGK